MPWYVICTRHTLSRAFKQLAVRRMTERQVQGVNGKLIARAWDVWPEVLPA